MRFIGQQKPEANASQRRASRVKSERPKNTMGLRHKSQPHCINGAEGQNRTADTGIFSFFSIWRKTAYFHNLVMFDIF
jgi:hypothetical protein